MKRYILLVFISLACAFNMQADGGVMLLCRPTLQDSILLRWAPTDKQTWDLGNRYGYVVERYTLLRKGKLLDEREFW
ncbi:hypothetical protein, partial [Candidatus Symbiothrix dinenymphae]|uniref:hypothetical protein n=1 Tax=Candidatus Symbiothrix dinenymphae TaxID=467085 RepID=UPI001315355A